MYQISVEYDIIINYIESTVRELNDPNLEFNSPEKIQKISPLDNNVQSFTVNVIKKLRKNQKNIKFEDFKGFNSD